MLISSSCIAIVLFLATLSSVTPLSHLPRARVAAAQIHEPGKSSASVFRPPSDEYKVDFAAWVSRVGKRFQQKKDSSPPTTQHRKTDVSYDDLQTWIVVDQNGYGQFSTVQDAINSIQKDQQRTERITIQINPGQYHEKIVVPKNVPYLTLQGGGRSNTLITNSDTEEQAGNDIADATAAFSAPNFNARNITFQNSAPAPPSGAVGQQATAVYVSGDQNAFYGCGFLGAQDTLYDHSGRHYFEDCYIEGSIDFIYGDATSLYKNSQLNVIPTATGSLTAQKRMSSSENTGFSFVDCTVTGVGRVFLGRAWGTHSRVVFATSWLADIIIPEGWQDWNDASRDWTVFYGEYNCFGPGADVSGRASWSHQLSYSDAEPFLTLNFIDGYDWECTQAVGLKCNI